MASRGTLLAAPLSAGSGHFLLTGATSFFRWNGETWSPLGLGISQEWDPLRGCQLTIVDPSIHTLAVYRDELIAGGGFKFAGGQSARHIARWNGDEWSSFGSGMSIAPGALTTDEGALIAGGGFRTLSSDGNARTLIATLNGHDWHMLGDGVSGSIHAIASYHGETYIGGKFVVTYDDTAAHTVARWDGSR
jgi:hypothetical protein